MMSSTLAFFLNISIFLCSIVNSPLTTSVVGKKTVLYEGNRCAAGQMKGILSTLLGLFLVERVELTGVLAAGLSMSTIGSLWYGIVKYNEQTAVPSSPSRTRVAKEVQGDTSDLEEQQ